MPSSQLPWEQNIQHDARIKLAVIDDFNARGMKRVYGRGDQFKNWTLNLDLWKNREGRLFARFWSPANLLTLAQFAAP